MGLSTIAQATVREVFYAKLEGFLQKEGLSGVRLTDGIVVRIPEIDVVIKVVMKKERVDIEGELAAIAQKAEEKAAEVARVEKKKLADKARREKVATSK